ncbi:tRNA1(Val) (adenine(37)-N6)-methyltransferase [Chitinophaga sancti]|uniref:tRNA1(Val) (adenine(37)-N6)-methyltransferase n=1 Tax=Chitinophaga sancti TaxID=1004 RepID=A0A1K1RX95_9BACT|nr:methyltransferase [Chitinophaga sancti]WQD64037.1 methyltransferase [Chitinophaga sancti]WQG90339.1 methyltransferase [Chitinophaga sancti]SFW76662.1 tRNA1Val (adenine37-N6)-methyltransferase [Chitinophaga sancti]
MANQFFSFRQFTVHQEDCAMKVCTDACLQGAYTASKITSAKRILDIGTGTGLLSLMLAQRFTDASITALELDTAAAAQATRNFAAAPWASRMKVVVGDARTLKLERQFDLIITNPPFYEGDLKSPDPLRNQAMHATTLSYPALLDVIDEHLSDNGVFSVLLPYTPFAAFEKLALKKGFFARQVVHIRHSVNHEHFRTIAIFGRGVVFETALAIDRKEGEEEMEIARYEETMSIRNGANEYTPEFIALLHPYYLYL